jgi:hypothetical protein
MGVCRVLVFPPYKVVSILPFASNADFLLTNESRKNWDAIHNTIHLHLLNHFLTIVVVFRETISESTNDEVVDDTDKYRDQGYNRPSVLVVLPTRGTGHSFFNSMTILLGDYVCQEKTLLVRAHR